jgi:branched-chain amino acid transport system permease protein
VTRSTRFEHRNELAVLAVVLAVPLVLFRDVPSGIYVSGLVVGASVSLHAFGVILAHQANRFLNFAQLAIGASAAWIFGISVTYQPIRRGIANLCPPCAPPASHTFDNVNYVVSLVLTLGLSILYAWLVYLVVARRFAGAPRLVATVGSIFAITALPAVSRVVIYFLTTAEQRELPLPTNIVVAPPFDVRANVLGVTFHLADLLTVVIAVGVVVALQVYFKVSANGVAIRAAAENPNRAETLGVNVGKVTTRVWLIIGVLSGVGALLGTMGGTAGSSMSGFGTLVLVFGVAVTARFSSLPMALVAGCALGIARQTISYHYGSTLPLDAVVVLVIAALLLAQRQSTGRGDARDATSWLAAREARPIPRELRSLPPVRSAIRWLTIVGLILLLGFPWVTAPAQTDLGASIAAFGIVGLSLLILTGWAGQVSLGQFALAAVGGWLTAVAHLPFFVELALSGVAGAVVAVVIGVPALKLRGLHLAISTLALAVSTSAVLLNPRYLGKSLPSTIERPRLLGIDFNANRAFYYFSFAVLAVVVLGVIGLRRSRTGRALIASRDNEAAVQLLGVSLLRLRLTAFAISGFLAAFAGSLYAYQQTGVRLNAFGPDQSVFMFLMTVIGGLGAISGPLIGAVYYGALSVFGASPLVRDLATGAGGLVVLMLAPGGLAKASFDLRDAFLRRVASRHRIVVASLTADRAAGDVDRAAPIAPRPQGGMVPFRYRLRDQWSVGLADRIAQPGESMVETDRDEVDESFQGVVTVGEERR